MKYEIFASEVLNLTQECPRVWRLGQSVFNIVEAMCGSIAREVQLQDGIDCFYDDTKIEDFLKAVHKRLTESEETENQIL